MFPNTQKFLAVLFLSIAITACGGSPDNNGPTGPAVTAVDPSSGSFNGGTPTLIWGHGFKTGAKVTFGGVRATVQTVSADNIWISMTPPHALGTVDVVVTNPDGSAGTCVNCFTYVESSQDIARRIMGPNYFGIEENERYFGITLSAADKAKYEVTYSEAMLTPRKDTHMLVLFLPGVSINDLQAKVPAGTIAFCDAFNASQPFASDRVTNGGWYLIRKDVVPGSLGLLESDQNALIVRGGKEAVPTARVLVYALVGHYLATGEVPLSGIFARTTDVSFPGGTNAMTVFAGGNAYGAKVGICSDWGEVANPMIGISSLWLQW